MFFKKILKSLIKEIKEGIEILFCKNFIPTSIYINYFKIRSKYKIKRDLSPCLKGDLFEIKEFMHNENLYWYFPSKLRYRGLTRYYRGIGWQGKILEKRYQINKLNLYSGDIIIDCGANFGDLLIYLNNLNLNNLVYYGFEPGKLEFEALNQNIKIKSINGNIYNKALANKNGIQKFYYSPNTADS